MRARSCSGTVSSCLRRQKTSESFLSSPPFPEELWFGVSGSACSWSAATPRKKRAEKSGPAARRPPRAMVQLGGNDAISRAAEHVRQAPSKRNAVVLARQFRRGVIGCGDRGSSSAGGADPERAVAEAPLPDRRRRPSGRERGYGVELPQRHVVDGHRRHRPGPAKGRPDNSLDEGPLGSRAPLQSRRRVPELHDG
jgi:hypothetical protein